LIDSNHNILTAQC